MGAYIGVGGKARKAAGMYVGVGGKARKVTKAYVGDDAGKAKPWFSAGEKLISFTFDLTATTDGSTVFHGTYHAYEGTTFCDWIQSDFAVCDDPWKVKVIVKGNAEKKSASVLELTNTNTAKVTHVLCEAGNPVILDGDKLSNESGSTAIVIEHAAG